MSGQDQIVGQHTAGPLSRKRCWDDIVWLRQHWHGPVIIKGILTPADAEIAAREGLDGIVVSNHGGRQLEGAPSAVEILPAIVAAAGRMHVFVDGGVRRGADIAKALAMGARGVLVGRAPLYGLAARGPRGVAEVLAILRGEFETTLRLLGIPQAARLDPAALSDDHAARLAAL